MSLQQRDGLAQYSESFMERVDLAAELVQLPSVDSRTSLWLEAYVGLEAFDQAGVMMGFRERQPIST